MNSELVFILAMLIGAGLLVLGLGVGYWRGYRRQRLDAQSLDSLDHLVDVGQAILSAQLNLDALCEIVYQQSTRVIDTRNFQLGLFDGDDYIIKVWLLEAERRSEHRFKGSGHKGIVGWIREEKQGLIIKDFDAEWESLPAQPHHYNPDSSSKSAIFAPLVAGGDVIGVIGAQSHKINTFAASDLRDMTVLANQAAGVYS